MVAAACGASMRTPSPFRTEGGTLLAILQTRTAMKNRLMFPLVLVAAWGVACSGDGARRGTQQNSYETVQEGSAAGVTSTIHGPGEVLPPVTGTNADTTTAFSIDPNTVSTAPAPLPPNAVAGAPMTTAPPPMPAPVPTTTTTTTAPARYPVPQTSAVPTRQPPPERKPEPAPTPTPAPRTET